MSDLTKVKEALIACEEELTINAVKEALDNGVNAKEIFDALADAMTEVGRKFGEMEIFLPEVMIATDAMKEAFAILKPEMVKSGGDIEQLGTVIIGTVQGDVHTVGKDMVTGVLSTNGFEVIDLGIDVEPATFLEAAERENADIIALSALMTATMPSQRDVIEFLKSKGVRDKYKVLVGGGVVTPEWADEIGADGYGQDAIEASVVAKKLIGK